MGKVKVGRNDRCRCGSGRKYKACCMLKGRAPSGSQVSGGVIGGKNDGKRSSHGTGASSSRGATGASSILDLLSLAGNRGEGSPKESDGCDGGFDDGVGEGEWDDFDYDYDDDDDIGINMSEVLLQMMSSLRMYGLKRLPHIKEYLRCRKLHEEVVESMQNYHDNGHFERTFDTSYVPEGMAGCGAGRNADTIHLLQANFDLESNVGIHAFFDMLIYKHMPNANSITEEYLSKNRFRKPEKVEFLRSMQSSVPGLFEVTDKDSQNG